MCVRHTAFRELAVFSELLRVLDSEGRFDLLVQVREAQFLIGQNRGLPPDSVSMKSVLASIPSDQANDVISGDALTAFGADGTTAAIKSIDDIRVFLHKNIIVEYAVYFHEEGIRISYITFSVREGRISQLITEKVIEVAKTMPLKKSMLRQVSVN